LAKYLYLYFGGSPPKSPEEGQKVMAAWMAWFGKVGNKLVDGGAPLGARKTIGKGNASGAGGYSIIEAGSLDEAVKLTDGHPHLQGGGTIEVCETMPVPM